MSTTPFRDWVLKDVETETLMLLHSRFGQELERRYHEAKRKQLEDAERLRAVSLNND